MSKDIKAKLVPISEVNGTVNNVVDINTGEKLSNSDGTLIYVNDNNVPISKEYLEKNDYAYTDENGNFHSVKPLPEVTVSPKASVIDRLGKYINDEILLNKDNIRVNNMRRLLSTESGRVVQKAFADGGRDATLLLGSSILIPSGIGTMVLNPSSTILGFGGSYLGGKAVDKLSTSINGKTWGQNVSSSWNKYAPTVAKMPEWVGDMTNPGAALGGAYGATKGLYIDSKKLIPKFFKGDPDLGWNPLNLDHWIFKEKFRPSNVALATANRVLPFLSNTEKTPLRIAAYQIGKRTKGNASVGIKDIISSESSYTGAATPSGNEGRNLLGLYLFGEDPLISKSPWFKKVLKPFTPAKGGFSFDNRYSELYPGVENRRYEMHTVVPGKTSIRFNSADELSSYAPIGKVKGKEGSIVIDTGNGYQAISTPDFNPVGPIDDVGGHVIKLEYDKKGRLYQTTQDLWKFNPRDYSIRYPENGIRATKQAALMDKVGFPFILQTTNPIKIGTSRIWESIERIPDYVLKGRTPRFQGAYITLKKGGRFKFRESSLVKNAKEKRDMRKKIIKSDRPTYSNRFIKKAKQGDTINYVTYNKLAPEVMDYEIMDIPDIMENNILEVFNPYSFLKQQEITEDSVEQSIEEGKKTTNWTPRNKEDYINTMGKALYKALEDNGIDPNVWTKYLLAQTAIESNWGKSSISTKYNNYGGIKGRGSGLVSTREYNPNRGYYSTKDSFRSFDSVEDFADFFVKRLRDKFEAFSTTPENYLKNIRKNGYFTAPLNDYANTFNSVLNSISIKAQKGDKLNYVTYTPIRRESIPSLTISDIPKPVIKREREESTISIVETPSFEYNDDSYNDYEEYNLSKDIEELFKDAGIKVRVTSSYRPGSRTSSGKTSWHSIKDEYGNSRAYDIVPIDGNFDSLREAMISNPLIRYYFSKKGLGVLDETSSSMMAKTGATGKHFHIGPDRLALETWDKWIS